MNIQPAYCRPAAYREFARRLASIDDAQGLFAAAWTIAQHEHPDADLAAGEAAVDKLVAAVRSRVRSDEPEVLLTHLHDLLFDVLGFRGNTEDYYAASNSYLPEVLRTRRGLPITLALLYRRLAAGLGLTVHGVNAPGHFLAEVELDPTGGAPSMYVDPFHGGGLLTPAEVSARVAETTGHAVEPSPLHLSRATPRQWLARMLRNLQAVFASTGRERDLYAMQELESLL